MDNSIVAENFKHVNETWRNSFITNANPNPNLNPDPIFILQLLYS